MPSILDAVARFVQPAAGQVASVQDVALAEVVPWGQALVGALIPQIVGMSMMGKACGDVDFDERGQTFACAGAARSQCSVCNRPVCLGHGFFSGAGECVCYSCARAAKTVVLAGAPAPAPRSRRASPAAGPPPGWRPASPPGPQASAPPPPPPPSPRPPAGSPPFTKEGEARARFVLGLTADSTLPDAQKAYRKLVAQCHPDGATDKQDYEWRHAEFLKAGAALDYLKIHVFKEAA